MDKSTRYVIPKSKELLIRFPNSPLTVLQEDGASVPWTGPMGKFWRRRLKDGSIIVFDDIESYKKTLTSVEKAKPFSTKPSYDVETNKGGNRQ